MPANHLPESFEENDQAYPKTRALAQRIADATTFTELQAAVIAVKALQASHASALKGLPENPDAALAALHDLESAQFTYKQMKLLYGNLLPPRKDIEARKAFVEALGILDHKLWTLRTALGHASSAWLDSEEIAIKHDLAQLDTDNRLRQLAPFLIGIGLVVIILIAVVLVLNQRRQAELAAEATQIAETRIANEAAAARIALDQQNATATQAAAETQAAIGAATRFVIAMESSREAARAQRWHDSQTVTANAILATRTQAAEHAFETEIANVRLEATTFSATQTQRAQTPTATFTPSITPTPTATSTPTATFTPNMFELTATGDAASTLVAQQAATATSAAYLVTTQAEAALRAEFANAECMVTAEKLETGTPNQGFGVYRYGQPILATSRIAIVREPIKVMDRQIVDGIPVFVFTEYEVRIPAGVAIPSNGFGYIRQDEVVFVDPLQCDRFFSPTATPTATPTPTDTLTPSETPTITTTPEAAQTPEETPADGGAPNE